MNQPRRVSPQMEAEIRRRLAAGEPLPPGVRISRPPGMPGMPPGAQPGVPTRETLNPLPSGPEGLQMLRQFTDCPIPKESQTLQAHINTVAQIKNRDQTIAIETAIAKGLTAAMRANVHCSENLRERIVVIFEKDDKLKSIDDEFKEIDARVDALQKELQELSDRGKQLLQDRWEKAVKAYGLSPEKFFYWIDEDKGTIVEVDLKCPECKGATTIRKARQDVGALAVELKKVDSKPPDES